MDSLFNFVFGSFLGWFFTLGILSLLGRSSDLLAHLAEPSLQVLFEFLENLLLQLRLPLLFHFLDGVVVLQDKGNNKVHANDDTQVPEDNEEKPNGVVIEICSLLELIYRDSPIVDNHNGEEGDHG